MRKKQSVTQRVVLDDDAPPDDKEPIPAELESEKVSDETEATTNEVSDTKGKTEDIPPNSVTADVPALASESLKEKSVSNESNVSKGDLPISKELKSNEATEQHNLFDEDGNAILPDGTLIIQPTDVDGDRPSSGPAPAPSEGSSLQFDFKDGNPDPKFIMAAQSGTGNAISMSGSGTDPGVLDVVKCTTCTTKLNPYHKDDLAVHPVLKVITCKRCMRWYNSVEWSKDEDGKDNQCRWCGEGGQLICCDVCHNTFCKTCIKRNLGRGVLQEIEDLPEDALWRCYVCDQGPLLPLQQGCAQILEKVEAYRMGKLQRKFKFQAGKKQSENKKPNPVAPTTVTVSVTPVPGIRPQIGVRMSAPSVVTSNSLIGPRGAPSNVNAVSSPARPQFTARLVQSVPRGPRSTLPNSGVGVMNSSSGINVGHRPMGNVLQTTQPARYPGSHVGRPQTAVRTMRPVGRPSNVSVAIPHSMNQNAAAAAAGSSAATEEWYEQNCSLREILREVNSVDPSNIELALKTTLKELQSWTRKCNHLENELRGALNDAQRRTVVHKFKSTFRLNLLLRLGKIHTLMQKESGLQMAVAAQRSAVMAAQAQSQGRSVQMANPMVGGNAKKLIVTSNRGPVSAVPNRMQPGRVSGGVIDLTEESAGSLNKSADILRPALSTLSSVPVAQISSVIGKADHKPSPLPAKPGPVLNNNVTTPSASSGRGKIRQRAGSSTHVSLVSSEEEDEDDGMIDDRSDKTWTGSVTHSPGMRRKSARLAAKTVPGSVTEGSDCSQGVDESDDSQNRLLVRLPYGRRQKKVKKASNDEDDKKMDVDNEEMKEDAVDDSPSDVIGCGNEVKDEAIEVVVDPTVVAAEDSNKDESSSKKAKEDSAENDNINHKKCKEDHEAIVSNGINNEDENGCQKADDDKEDASTPPADRLNEKSESPKELKSEVEGKSSGSQEITNSINENSVSEEKVDESLHSNEECPTTIVESDLDHNQTNEVDTEKSDHISEPRPDSSQLDATGEDKESASEAVGENEVDDGNNSPSRSSARKCITVSMWGPADDGEELVIPSTEMPDREGMVGAFNGRKRVSEMSGGEDSAKRQKLDQ